MFRCMETSGVRSMALLALFRPIGADDNPIISVFSGLRPGETQNETLLNYKRSAPERFYIFGAIEYGVDTPSQIASVDDEMLADRLAEQPAQLKAAGFDGLKLVESKAWMRRMYPWPLDGPVYAKFFDCAEREGMPVMWHVGDPARFWDASKPQPTFVEQFDWLYTRPGDPKLEELRKEALAVVERHPKLRVILAHFFFIDDDLDRARELLNKHQNVYLDTTQHWELFVNLSANREKARKFFMDFQDRLLFGSDSVFGDESQLIWSGELAARYQLFMKQFFATDDIMPPDFPALAIPGFAEPGTVIRGLGLPDDVLHKFYHANFERIVSKKPRPVG